MKTQVSEKLIARIWQCRLATNLVTDSGELFQTIYPGRASQTSGCDFKDAVFAISNKIISGDVEIHVKSSQWYSHGHHRDPKYNNIALHVVWWRDNQSPAMLQNGKAVPTICLSPFLGHPSDELNQHLDLSGNSSFSCPEAKGHSNSDSLNKLLTLTGEERFAAKAALFRQALEKEETGQVLFLGIARALGYAQNAEPCEDLVNRLPISFLEKIEPEAIRRALILGTAGLLPSQRPRLQLKLAGDEEIDKLERIWQSTDITETMNEADWCFFRVRPDNFPTRRLIALSYLIDRYCRRGLLHGILHLVKKAPPKTEHRWLENGLVIAGQAYWRNHFDFGIVKKRSSALLGREKASEIVINAILPFACVWGEISSDLKLKKKTAEIYRRYPRSEDNELTRHMKQQLLLKPDTRLSACQQQGLIHIFKTYCRLRNCTVCPVAFNRS
ncbi:MAG: DUF2851 family protein [Chloroflexi bacterium]|nr:DUF2851 family protein [Chloroflexota bacterium]